MHIEELVVHLTFRLARTVRWDGQYMNVYVADRLRDQSGG